MPELRMLQYKSDIAALRVTVGKQIEGRLRCVPTSANLIEVTCVAIGGTGRLVCHMFSGDLYILGFNGAGGKRYFFTETQVAKRNAVMNAYQFQTGNIRAAAVTAEWTGFGADYGSLGCHNTFKDRAVTAAEIGTAITTLSAYGGTSDDLTKFYGACITHYVSEAMRFAEIESAVARVIAERNKAASFTFGDFKEVVTSWSDQSSGNASTALKQSSHVKILAG